MYQRAEASQKDTSAVKNVTGRQLARVNTVKYGETLWSELYPGNQHTVNCLQPAVTATESSLELAKLSVNAPYGGLTAGLAAMNSSMALQPWVSRCWQRAIQLPRLCACTASTPLGQLR